VNKRARLTRRILRDHRKGHAVHLEIEAKMPPHFVMHGFWHCTHCTWVSRFIHVRVPRAYR